jgi:hypothetical protein
VAQAAGSGGEDDRFLIEGGSRPGAKMHGGTNWKQPRPVRWRAAAAG